MLSDNVRTESDVFSHPACSRRVFLEKTLMGAASVARGIGYSARPVGIAMLNATAVTAADDLANLDLHEAATLVRQKKVSPVQLAQACLARIEALNPRLNAFITVTGESALAQARQAEAELQSGKWRGPLHGIPIALKDLIDTVGVRTTGGSALFKDRVPREDAVVVQRLRDGGAVFLGKLNMYEVAFGPTTQADKFLWSRRESVGDRAHFRGIVERSGSGRRRRPLFWRDRLGHGRFDSTAVGILRCRRSDAQLRAREHAGRDTALVVGGPSWTDDAQRG